MSANFDFTMNIFRSLNGSWTTAPTNVVTNTTNKTFTPSTNPVIPANVINDRPPRQNASTTSATLSTLTVSSTIPLTIPSTTPSTIPSTTPSTTPSTRPNATNETNGSILRDLEQWRPENRGVLIPRGNRDDPSLANQLLYAATHVNESQRRHIANLIAKERLYRRMFCGHHASKNDDGLDASLVNGDLSFIKYRDEERELNLETLCQHIETIIQSGYSLTYTFAYLSYLRRKYRAAYPKLRGQTSEFYRILINNYEKQRRLRKRIGTDEVYTCEESIYEKMYELSHDHFFSETTEQPPFHDNARRNRCLFAYVFIFMFITGKRLSEIALIGVTQLRTLQRYEALVIRIPKAKKLGRIVMRDYDEDVRSNFKRFLERAVEIFAGHRYANVVPFNQFEKRRTLDKLFAKSYNEAARSLQIADETKPRGLSLHSLRRFRAATLFAEGKAIDHIRECLDHSSTKVTNMYINKHLMRSYRTNNIEGRNTNIVENG